jgi:protein-tyrosine phosphatase
MKILMVCLGNICRSPLAHGILEGKVKAAGLDIEVDSAGTNGYHDGELPDSRSVSKANEYDLDITDQRSRQITKNDIQEFDLIYVMDTSNYNNVIAHCNSEEEKAKVKMIMNEIEPGKNISIPDPYFGGEDGFEKVYQMLDLACDKIITQHFN